MSGLCPWRSIRLASYSVQSAYLLPLGCSIESLFAPTHLQCLIMKTSTTKRRRVRSNTKMRTTSVSARDTSRRPNLRIAVAVAAAAIAMSVITAIVRMKMDVMRIWVIVQSMSRTGESTLIGTGDHHGLTSVLVSSTPRPWACT